MIDYGQSTFTTIRRNGMWDLWSMLMFSPNFENFSSHWWSSRNIYEHFRFSSNKVLGNAVKLCKFNEILLQISQVLANFPEVLQNDLSFKLGQNSTHFYGPLRVLRYQVSLLWMSATSKKFLNVSELLLKSVLNLAVIMELLLNFTKFLEFLKLS